MKKSQIAITIIVDTGLHIGIGGDKAQIGGIDGPVIKDPITKVPYIPGSSLKGKLRCLLETEAKAHYHEGENDPKINKYFGATSEFLKNTGVNEGKDSAKKENQGKKKDEGKTETNSPFEQSLSKFIFRDLMMSETQKKEYIKGNYPLEVKTEISINRTTGTVSGAGPRTNERIPPGTEFSGVILLRYKDKKELDEMHIMMDRAFMLLANDALGGSGSRGYGAVKSKLTINGNVTEYKLNEEPQNEAEV